MSAPLRQVFVRKLVVCRAGCACGYWLAKGGSGDAIKLAEWVWLETLIQSTLYSRRRSVILVNIWIWCRAISLINFWPTRHQIVFYDWFVDCDGYTSKLVVQMKFETSFAAFQPSPIAKWNDIKIKSNDTRVSFAVAKIFFLRGATYLSLIEWKSESTKVFFALPFLDSSSFRCSFSFLYFFLLMV